MAKDSEEISGFLATPWLDATYYSMWIEEKVNQPLSMAHNVLEIVGGSVWFSFHYRVASIRHTREGLSLTQFKPSSI